MDPMIIGRTLMKKASTVGTYYTHWQPREGNSGTFSFEVLVNINIQDLTLTVQTKTLQQPDSAAINLGTATGGVGVNSVNCSGCCDVVRCKITTPNNVVTGDYFIRVLECQWEHN